MNVKITDVRALIGAMGWLNAMSAMTLAWWPGWLGRFMLETSVTYDPVEPVKHTTTITWLGLKLLTSTEFVTLVGDGKSFTVTGESRNSFLPWRVLRMKGRGEIDPSGERASYRITWMGAQMRQETQRTDDGVILKQYAPGYASEEYLKEIHNIRS